MAEIHPNLVVLVVSIRLALLTMPMSSLLKAIYQEDVPLERSRSWKERLMVKVVELVGETFVFFGFVCEKSTDSQFVSP
jgi:hypothetical protein